MTRGWGGDLDTDLVQVRAGLLGLALCDTLVRQQEELRRGGEPR